jgi:hypothetical protein
MATTRSRAVLRHAPRHSAKRAQHQRAQTINKLGLHVHDNLECLCRGRLYLVAHYAAEAFQDDLQEDTVVALFVVRDAWLNSS